MNFTVRRGLHLAGSALAIAGIGFVLMRLRDYSTQIDLARISIDAWLLVAVFAIIYALANVLLANAWGSILAYLEEEISPKRTIKIFGVSQLAKYLPGNIFHLAGRQALGVAEGLSGVKLAKSAIWELGLISVAGAFFSLLALPLLIENLNVTTSLVTFTCVSLLGGILLKRAIGNSIAKAWFYYLGFLVISGGLFVCIFSLVSIEPSDEKQLLISMVGAFVIAWLAGMLTPGAPAGIGVRELVLLFLLSTIVVESDLLIAVLIGRIVTVAGDLLFYLAAISLKDKPPIIDNSIK